MSNALDPNLMTPAERLTEVGEILAAGLLRLRAREREAGDRRETFPGLPRQPERPWPETKTKRKAMNNSVLAQVAALPEKSTAELKQLWRDLYDREPPPYNKPFLVKRLAYRIQELAYGGLSARAEAKLTELIEEEDRRVKGKLPVRKGDRPIAGTRLIREWQGVEHTATVLDDGFEYQGRRYKSLSAIARAITGTRWNGPAFFGLRNHRSCEMKTPVRKVRCAIYTRVSTDERLDMEFNSLDAQREAALAYIQSQKHEGWILVGDRYDDGGFSGGSMDRPALQRLLARCRERSHRRDRRLQGGPAEPLAHRLRKNCRSIRKEQSLVREHNPAIQHDDVDGPADAQHPALLRPVRARGDRRAHPRQVRRLAPQGHVDGRHAAARLRRASTASWW